MVVRQINVPKSRDRAGGGARRALAKCRGQCYDGASNMLGHRTGVAKRIQDLQPKAYPTHCHGHSLSLSVKVTT